MAINLDLSFAALVPRCLKTPATALDSLNSAVWPNSPRFYGEQPHLDSRQVGERRQRQRAWVQTGQRAGSTVALRDGVGGRAGGKGRQRPNPGGRRGSVFSKKPPPPVTDPESKRGLSCFYRWVEPLASGAELTGGHPSVTTGLA